MAGPSGQAAPAPDNRSFVSRWADAIRSAVGSVFSSSEPSKTADLTASEPVPEKPKPRARAKAHAQSAAPREQPPLPQVSPVRSAAMIPAPYGALGGGLEDPAIYTSADPGVQPPIMTRPLLPAEPPPSLPPSQVGTLDLIIDTSGNVERVKLTSPANRFEERMLVSHAKSWKFKPAMRDGKPVKYRTRVRVTI